MENKNIPNLNFTIKDAIAKSQEININDILKKICVSPPYFAFKKIYKYQNYFIAPFRVEQSEHQEGNKISIAESGRHLAIAGSIANAFTTNSKHYYLAMNALMNFYQQSNASDLFVVIKQYSYERNSASAYGLILDNLDRIIYDISLTYQKITEKLFYRIFKSFFEVNIFDTNINPYYNIKIEGSNLNITNNVLNVELKQFANIEFVGHFEKHPMLPVSILAYYMVYYAGVLYRKINKVENFFVKEVNLEIFYPVSNKDHCKIIVYIENGLYKCYFMNIIENKKFAQICLTI